MLFSAHYSRISIKFFSGIKRERAFERFLLSDIPTVCHFNNKEAKASERLPAGRQEARMSEDAFSRLYGLKPVNNAGQEQVRKICRIPLPCGGHES
jgi:hypothetical protein